MGREKELDIIASALSPDSRTWGALIDGPGGIGKTALAIKATHGASAELFERKIFITAKIRELTPEGEAKLTDFTRPTYRAVEIYTRLRHPELQSAQETLEEIEERMKDKG